MTRTRLTACCCAAPVVPGLVAGAEEEDGDVGRGEVAVEPLRGERLLLVLLVLPERVAARAGVCVLGELVAASACKPDMDTHHRRVGERGLRLLGMCNDVWTQVVQVLQLWHDAVAVCCSMHLAS